MSSLAGLEEALEGFIAGFEQAGLPGCPIGTLAAEVAGRNEDARLQAAAGFDGWELLLLGGRAGDLLGRRPGCRS